MTDKLLVESLFGEILREAIAEKQQSDEGMGYQNVAWSVVSGLHAACLGYKKGAYQYAMDLYPRGSDDEEERKASDARFEAVHSSPIGNLDFLHSIGLTEAMEKEAFRQILAVELTEYPRNDSPEEREYRVRFDQHRYYTCMQFAYRYMQEFTKAYLEYAESLANCDEDRIAERLERR